ncbi:hypothetical protein [Rhizobium phaseoli]|uniref:phosphoribosylanthranilate isomerase n=1 Tax=Rhizobium phaseoli TaxID=396 RepID=UPI00202ABA20|nr:hypothetical protein [Rhizobium phaseoli]
MRARVKICGITSLEDARAAVDAGADALGFVFSRSPRQVSPNEVREIVSELPPFVAMEFQWCSCKARKQMNTAKRLVDRLSKASKSAMTSRLKR